MMTVTLARKPHTEPSVQAAVDRHHTGALHVDATRIDLRGEVLTFEHTESTGPVRRGYPQGTGERHGAPGPDKVATDRRGTWTNTEGRWPANLILAHRAAGHQPPGVAGATDGGCHTEGCVEGCPIRALGEVGRYYLDIGRSETS